MIRINKENQIRQEYVDTWMKPSYAVALAKTIGADTTLLKDIISKSMGNYRNISEFLLNASADYKQLAVKILTLIADKDLRDIKKEVLLDHLNNSFRYQKNSNDYDSALYFNYVLNPRIANEIIIPWRNYIIGIFGQDFKKQASPDPSKIISYLNNRIIIDDSDNYYKTPITPRGVNELKVSDRSSRDIFFVAICRSLGIPSRLEPGSNVPQYYFKKGWKNAYFAADRKTAGENGYLQLISSDRNPIPEYYIHFTIARFEDGRYNTLEYDFNKKITDFKDELPLIPGHYMLVTGNRISDSKILSSISFFDLGEDEHKILNISLRQNQRR
jgi:hypothetical protein